MINDKYTGRNPIPLEDIVNEAEAKRRLGNTALTRHRLYYHPDTYPQPFWIDAGGNNRLWDYRDIVSWYNALPKKGKRNPAPRPYTTLTK